MIKTQSRFYKASKDAKPYRVNGQLMQGQEFRTFHNMFGFKSISVILNWKDGLLNTDWDADPVIPAVQMTDGHTEYWTMGKLDNQHRNENDELQAAVISDNFQHEEYWIDGEQLNSKEINADASQTA